MRSTAMSLIVGLVVVGIVGFGIYFLVNKFRAGADVDLVSFSCENADFNKDGEVNVLDLNMITTAISSNTENPKYDLNKDGVIDDADIGLVTSCWTANR